ncbi:hypothetical protein RCJ22_01145, partial [Vibrio sp. FNV 38]|nr:hypothetical protein [Vibrio sp. FNV 38]
PNAARVLDVFYWTNDSGKYDADINTDEDADDYATLVGTEASKADRHKNYKGTGILGWCGGEEVVKAGAFLDTPTIEVINAERLLVKVTDPNIASADSTIIALNPKLKLFIEGRTSGAVAYIQLTKTVDANG